MDVYFLCLILGPGKGISGSVQNVDLNLDPLLDPFWTTGPPIGPLSATPIFSSRKYGLLIWIISNSNWTECSTIQGVISRVISKSDEREARGRFEITSTITP